MSCVSSCEIWVVSRVLVLANFGSCLVCWFLLNLGRVSLLVPVKFGSCVVVGSCEIRVVCCCWILRNLGRVSLLVPVKFGSCVVC